MVKRISKERILKPFDILVNSTGVGTLGRVAQLLMLPEAATVDSHITIVRADPQKVFPRYLGFALRKCQPEIEALAEGPTGQTELSRARLAKLRIPLPPIEEQQAIACILGALDDKIELNRKMNQTLEAMARAIFQSWFVDFDPVRAKAAVRREHPNWTSEQISRAACPKLKPEIAALFPDSFEDSELGEIPKGWEVTPLSELTTLITKGTTPTQGDVNNSPDSDEVVSYVRANCIEEDGSILADKLLNIPLSVHRSSEALNYQVWRYSLHNCRNHRTYSVGGRLDSASEHESGRRNHSSCFFSSTWLSDSHNASGRVSAELV